MTSLSGEFQTDLGIDDAMVACTEAIDGIGWRIETVDSQRVIAFTDSGAHPPRIEVNLNESGDGTEFRIIGSDNEQNQLDQDELIAVLDKARDAINRSMEDAERPRESSSSASDGQTEEREQPKQSSSAGDADAPAGWYPDVHDESRQRYWDGKQWTDDFRPADDSGTGSESSPQGEQKPEKTSRKEAREEKRRQSRERAEQRRQERLEKRKERAQQSGASGSGETAGAAAAAGAAAGGAAAAGAAAGDAAEPQRSEPEKTRSDEDGSRGEQGGASGALATLTSRAPDDFGSLRLISTLYYYLGFIVLIGGGLAVIVTAIGVGGAGALATLIGGAIGVAFYALLVFGIAAAIRLALAVEKNTRDTAEALRRDRGA
jgi:hypothetical protein